MTAIATLILSLTAALLSAGCIVPDPPSDGQPDLTMSPSGSPDAQRADLTTPLVSLDRTPGAYQALCDGSGAVALDGDHFLNVNDENQIVGIYRRGATAMPLAQVDISIGIGLTSADEADLEAAARIGSRVYVTASHGRNNKGELRPARSRFFALDLTGSASSTSVRVAGSSTTLLADLLDAANWATPDSALISLLQSTSKLTTPTDANLAPEVGGTNIEALAALPLAAAPGRLVIGFRNPQSGADAILVTLLNADALLTGAKARFGEAFRFNLGGLGVRDLAWSDTHQALLILAGPKASGPFRLYKWSGVRGEPPIAAGDLTPPADRNPEAIVPYPGTLDVQIVFDMGDFMIGGAICKDAPLQQRYFSDQIVRVD